MWFYSTAGITTFMGMEAKAGFTVKHAFMPIVRELRNLGGVAPIS